MIYYQVKFKPDVYLIGSLECKTKILTEKEYVDAKEKGLIQEVKKVKIQGSRIIPAE